MAELGRWAGRNPAKDDLRHAPRRRPEKAGPGFGGRTGHGAGFADLESGIFRTIGLIGDATPTAAPLPLLARLRDRMSAGAGA